ncbi:unnamed protein product [Hermetia illucens]|uniref:Chitin-binding type-2 domain-containing protein n=1 Tax=Hermetia illucens TaxID=343691 RepID=A0A7R8UH73_HERIL|nr:uncharacterized protein LOC119650272 [Hermetia illucens]CAD7080543.1 unnamed protein product [Hermetia illucens]
MKKDTFRGLIILALIASVCGDWDCIGVKLYELQEDTSDETRYFVCFTEKSDPIFYDCPDEYKFNVDTKSCTLELVGRTEPSCAFEGEVFVASNSDPCDQYWLCDESLSAETKTCDSDLNVNPNAKDGSNSNRDAEYRFNSLLLQCVPKKYWLCGDGIPDCSQTDQRNQKWSNIQDCGSFYQCIGNTLTKQNCPSGFYFNVTAQSCFHNAAGLCQLPTDWLPGLLVDPENMCKGNVGKFLPDPYYCKAYYYCVAEDTPYWKPCEDDLYFNNGACTKTVPSTCICETIDWEELLPSTATSVAHPNPSKYYFCKKGFVAVEESCPPGMVFNAKEKLCSY